MGHYAHLYRVGHHYRAHRQRVRRYRSDDKHRRAWSHNRASGRQIVARRSGGGSYKEAVGAVGCHEVSVDCRCGRDHRGNIFFQHGHLIEGKHAHGAETVGRHFEHSPLVDFIAAAGDCLGQSFGIVEVCRRKIPHVAGVDAHDRYSGRGGCACCAKHRAVASKTEGEVDLRRWGVGESGVGREREVAREICPEGALEGERSSGSGR